LAERKASTGLFCSVGYCELGVEYIIYYLDEGLGVEYVMY